MTSHATLLLAASLSLLLFAKLGDGAPLFDEALDQFKKFVDDVRPSRFLNPSKGDDKDDSEQKFRKKRFIDEIVKTFLPLKQDDPLSYDLALQNAGELTKRFITDPISAIQNVIFKKDF